MKNIVSPRVHFKMKNQHQTTTTNVDHTKIDYQVLDLILPVLQESFCLYTIYDRSWIIKVRVNIRNTSNVIQDHKHLIHLTKLPKKQGQLGYPTHQPNLKLPYVLSRHYHSWWSSVSLLCLITWVNIPNISCLSPIFIIHSRWMSPSHSRMSTLTPDLL